MTSVIGHLTSLDFDQPYKHWKSCRPGQLFDAPVVEEVATVGRFTKFLYSFCCHFVDRFQNKEPIADNITNQARYAKALFIWTDCDREGEYIGSEVRQAALKGNSRLEVKRAQFSNTERAYDPIHCPFSSALGANSSKVMLLKLRRTRFS